MVGSGAVGDEDRDYERIWITEGQNLISSRQKRVTDLPGKRHIFPRIIEVNVKIKPGAVFCCKSC